MIGVQVAYNLEMVALRGLYGEVRADLPYGVVELNRVALIVCLMAIPLLSLSYLRRSETWAIGFSATWKGMFFPFVWLIASLENPAFHLEFNLHRRAYLELQKLHDLTEGAVTCAPSMAPCFLLPDRYGGA